jgi:hypothetical protein
MLKNAPMFKCLDVKIKVNYVSHSFCLMPITFPMDYEIIQYKTFFLHEGVLKKL